jgi:hypothetical protein
MRVQTEQSAIPAWAKKFALPGFTLTTDVIWVKGMSVARTIARYDAACGGKSIIERVVARHCILCGGWAIEDIEEYMRQISNPHGPEPCGSLCKPRVR